MTECIIRGAATTRTALALLAASGAPARVVDEARERAAELDAIKLAPTQPQA